MGQLQITRHGGYYRRTFMMTRFPTLCCAVLACMALSWTARAETKSAYVVLLVDGHKSMAGADILEPIARFAGKFGEQNELDLIGVMRVHTAYKGFRMRYLIDGRDKPMKDVRNLNLDGSSRKLGKALRLSNDYILASPDPSRIQVIVLVHGGGDDGDSTLLNAQLEKAKSGKVRIHTVSVGKNADRALLKRMASTTQGRYFQANGAGDLPEILGKVMENIDRDREDQPLLEQKTYRDKKPVDDESNADLERRKRIEKSERERERRRRRRKSRDDDKDDEEDEDEYEEEEESSRENADSGMSIWIWIVLGVLLLAGGGVGLFFLLRKKGGRSRARRLRKDSNRFR